MALAGSLQFSPLLGICRNREPGRKFKCFAGRGNKHLGATNLSSCASRQDLWSHGVSVAINRPRCSLPYKCNAMKCDSFLFGPNVTNPAMETANVVVKRSFNALQGSSFATKLVPAVGIIVFALWGLGPLMRMSRNFLLHKPDSNWKKSTTYYVMTSYLQPILLWSGAILVCRAWDPVAMPTAASQLVKQRILTFVKSLSTVLAFAYCLSSAIQQAQKYFTEATDPSDANNMGFQFAGKALYTAVWVAAVSLFMELLGFSTQKWLTAGGLGTVLLTLAGREIFTNFLSSAMIHATRPFMINDWIQTKIEGYEVSGHVEHIGWWSPTIIRGDDREAIHIPNHKFTMNVVRNLSQKTHWRIKTHLAISHLDVGKINNIVADMRKVLSKNPQVEQQRLHRRVFLEHIDPENQALLILISCFVKTSHFEEFLCVKEAILLDLLRVIRHHRARLATPIRTIRKVYGDVDLEGMPFSETTFTRGGPASRRPLLLVEPLPQRINGENKSKSQSQPRSVRTNAEQESGSSTSDPKSDNNKAGGTLTPDLNAKESSTSGKSDGDKVAETSSSDSTDSKPSGSAAGGDDVSKNSENVETKQNFDSKKADEKSRAQTSGPKSKQAEKSAASEPAKPATAALEENLVLGVALEGSKRTLPIEEELDSAEAKELAAHRNGQGNSAPEKDEKDT